MNFSTELRIQSNTFLGYFAISLESGLQAEMTASERASLFKFSFADDTNVQHPVLMQDGEYIQILLYIFLKLIFIGSDLPASHGHRSLYVDAETGRMTAEVSILWLD